MGLKYKNGSHLKKYVTFFLMFFFLRMNTKLEAVILAIKLRSRQKFNKHIVKRISPPREKRCK